VSAVLLIIVCLSTDHVHHVSHTDNQAYLLIVHQAQASVIVVAHQADAVHVVNDHHNHGIHERKTQFQSALIASIEVLAKFVKERTALLVNAKSISFELSKYFQISLISEVRS
jgi:flagellar motor component MotA